MLACSVALIGLWRDWSPIYIYTVGHYRSGERMSWQIKCKNCGKWFTSPIQFASKSNVQITNTDTQCPHCGKPTEIDIKTARQNESSGISGHPTIRK